MFTSKITIAHSPIKTFLTTYQDIPRFLKYCEKCPNYNTKWSCPPLNVNPIEYFAGYNYIYLIGVQIFYDENIIKQIVTKEDVYNVSIKVLRNVKKQLASQLLTIEKQIPNSISLSSGGCNWCCKCNRIKHLPCKKPEKMRYSLDSFGVDLTAVTQKFLRIKLLWNSDRLPQYHTLIHALLTKDSIDKKFFTFNIKKTDY